MSPAPRWGSRAPNCGRRRKPQAMPRRALLSPALSLGLTRLSRRGGADADGAGSTTGLWYTTPTILVAAGTVLAC